MKSMVCFQDVFEVSKSYKDTKIYIWNTSQSETFRGSSFTSVMTMTVLLCAAAHLLRAKPYTFAKLYILNMQNYMFCAR